MNVKCMIMFSFVNCLLIWLSIVYIESLIVLFKRTSVILHCLAATMQICREHRTYTNALNVRRMSLCMDTLLFRFNLLLINMYKKITI